jgi:plastocyanin
MRTPPIRSALTQQPWRLLLGVLTAAAVGLPLPVWSALTIPSDGSDGALNITADTTIDLSQAVAGQWDASNTAHAGKGIYDATKWAVVFKYTDVTIAAGATVTFTNHPGRAPVVWLISGNATIAGTVNLKGGNWVAAPALAEPGPGGFRGGMAYFTPGVTGGAGFGPGGGGTAVVGQGGSHGAVGSGTGAGPLYGNPSLIPLLGGSGGGGDTDTSGQSGAAGGGAILLACTGTLSITGTITANGGNSAPTGYNSAGGSGSGGGIRLVAGTLAGNGVIQAVGGSVGNPGGLGRIRIERVANAGNPQVVPDPSVVALADGSTPILWPPADGPLVRIVSIGGEAVPADPRASFGSAGADATIAQVSTTPVIVETTHVEEAAQVFVRVTPRANANYTRTQASSHEVIGTDPLVIRWTASVPVQAGYSAMQVHVIRP